MIVKPRGQKPPSRLRQIVIIAATSTGLQRALIICAVTSVMTPGLTLRLAHPRSMTIPPRWENRRLAHPQPTASIPWLGALPEPARPRNGKSRIYRWRCAPTAIPVLQPSHHPDLSPTGLALGTNNDHKMRPGSEWLSSAASVARRPKAFPTRPPTWAKTLPEPSWWPSSRSLRRRTASPSSGPPRAVVMARPRRPGRTRERRPAEMAAFVTPSCCCPISVTASAKTRTVYTSGRPCQIL